jgi:hypothetical protein
MKAKTGTWGKAAIDKSVVWSDAIGGRVNDIAEKRFGTEHFWPVTGDFGNEMDKCARILRAFTGESGAGGGVSLGRELKRGSLSELCPRRAR